MSTSSQESISSLKTIIGFDSWTKGAHHYERLVQSFQNEGYRLILVHIGSWGHDIDRPTSEKIGSLEVKDISHYSNTTLQGVLLKEKPVAVLFLSTRAFVHQAFNRYAQKLGIPTFHLYHGLVNVQPVGEDDFQLPYQTSIVQQFRALRTRLGKNIRKIIPTYLRSLIDTQASFSDWCWFIRELHFKIAKPLSGIAPPDCQTYGGFVYTPADVMNMVNTYRVDKNRVFVVGNPDIIHFGLDAESLGLAADDMRLCSNDVVYIDTGLVEAGLVFADDNEFIEHILKTRHVLATQGFNLVVKLHPSHFRSSVAKKLISEDIEIISNDHFVSRLKLAVCVLTEPSSAAMLPALMGLPLFLVMFGKLANQRYGQVLTSYPRSRIIKDLNAFNAYVSQEHSELNKIQMAEWISLNSGPMPAQLMPNRVTTQLINLLKASASQLQLHPHGEQI